MTEPSGQRLQDISTRLKALQEGDSDFLDDEWILCTWARLKKDLINEIRKRDALIALHNSPAQEMNNSHVDENKMTSDSQPQPVSVEISARSGEVIQNEIKAPESQETNPSTPKVKKLGKADQFLAHWQVGDKVESCDCQGAWYRATIQGVSYSRRQVSPALGSLTKV